MSMFIIMLLVWFALDCLERIDLPRPRRLLSPKRKRRPAKRLRAVQPKTPRQQLSAPPAHIDEADSIAAELRDIENRRQALIEEKIRRETVALEEIDQELESLRERRSKLFDAQIALETAREVEALPGPEEKR